MDVPAMVRSVVNLPVKRWVSMEEMNTNLSIFWKISGLFSFNQSSLNKVLKLYCPMPLR